MLMFCIKSGILNDKVVKISYTDNRVFLDDIRIDVYANNIKTDLITMVAGDFIFPDNFNKTNMWPEPQSNAFHKNGTFFIVFENLEEYKEFYAKNICTSIERTFVHDEYLKKLIPAPMKIEDSLFFVTGKGAVSFTISGLKAYESAVSLSDSGNIIPILEVNRSMWDFEFKDNSVIKNFFDSITYNIDEKDIETSMTKTLKLTVSGKEFTDTVTNFYKPTKDSVLIIY